MADQEHPADDQPLLIGEVLTFASADAIAHAAADMEELGGLNADVVGDPPAAGPLQVQFALGDLVESERHQARAIPRGGDTIALSFRDRVSAAKALRQLASQGGAPAIDGTDDSDDFDGPDTQASIVIDADALGGAADSEEIVVEPASGARPEADSAAGIVMLIEDTLTFDSTVAVNAFINELQDDGGVVVESLGTQLPESGQVELGLSLAGQASLARHAAVAMQEDDDKVALVFRDPDGVIADLRQIGSGGSRTVTLGAEASKPAPAAAGKPRKGPTIGGPAVELDANDAIAAALAEIEGGGRKAVTSKPAAGKPGPALDLDTEDAFAAALAEVEGGGRGRSAHKGGPSDEAAGEDAGAGAPAKAPPKIAASKLPPALPEEEKALAAGALVNPIAPKDILSLRLAKQVDPRGLPQQSVADLLGGLAMIRGTGELLLVCSELRFTLPFLGGAFFARDDELSQLDRAMKHATGRFALIDMPVKSAEKSRTSRPARVAVVDLLRRILMAFDPDELQTGLAAIKYKYALTVPNLSYIALGFKMTPKENVFLSEVTNGTRAVAELAGASGTMTQSEALAFVYLCIMFDMVKLTDEPRESRKGALGLKIKTP